MFLQLISKGLQTDLHTLFVFLTLLNSKVTNLKGHMLNTTFMAKADILRLK